MIDWNLSENCRSLVNVRREPGEVWSLHTENDFLVTGRNTVLAVEVVLLGQVLKEQRQAGRQFHVMGGLVGFNNIRLENVVAEIDVPGQPVS